MTRISAAKLACQRHFFGNTRIHETFPDFFVPKTVDMTDPMSDLIALARYNMERGHDEIDRLIAIMEKREGVAKKEKTA